MKNYIWIAITLFCFFDAAGQDKKWWRATVVYQIYPQSFKDADGDGIGDLKGITQKIDYLHQLGVETIWINPFYKSPGLDNGYDIADYLAIDPQYGTMADFDALLAGLKKRKMHLIMDMVLNHTSSEHEWFRQGSSSRQSPFHDFYIWQKGNRDSLPNNWPSIFGGSAWTWNEQTREYYLHMFLDKQPDLNWDNPLVRQSLYKMMRFWLDKGVDGFRLDAISLISKNKSFPPMDLSKGIFAALNGNVNNGPHLHRYLHEMNDQVLRKYNVFTVGEVYTDKDSAWQYVAPARNEISAIHFFDGLWLSGKTTGIPFKNTMDGWNTALSGKQSWNTVILTNHDYPRAVSRIGNDSMYRVESAKMLGAFLLTYRGTPFIFQGEELGMTNYPFNNISEIKDVTAHTGFAALQQQGMSDSAAFVVIAMTTRDNARTPIQWDASPNAGFTTAEKPWLSVNPDFTNINAASQQADTMSVLHFYARLIALRKANPVLIYGDFEDKSPKDPSLYVYTRTLKTKQWQIVLNMTATEVDYTVPTTGKLVLSSYGKKGQNDAPSVLRPYEARIYRLH